MAVLECEVLILEGQHCSFSSCSSGTDSDGSSSPAPAYSGGDATPAPVRADAVLAGTTAPMAEQSTSGGVAGDANKAATHSPLSTSASGAVGAAITGVLVMVATMVLVYAIVVIDLSWLPTISKSAS